MKHTDKKKVVFGTGWGYGEPMVAVDDSWKVYCVRGPLTAKSMGVPEDLAITDAALLISGFVSRDDQVDAGCGIAYVPHWSHASFGWKEVCERCGVKFIDPRCEVEVVLDGIRKSSLVICEAMHGAIVADALGIPWLAVRSSDSISTLKWRDWTLAIEVELQMHRLPALWGVPHSPTYFQRSRQEFKMKLATYCMRRLIRQARPVLSDRSLASELHDRLHEKLLVFTTDVRKGLWD